MVPSSCMAEHNNACRLQLAGRSRRRSRSAQRVPRWQTRGALMFCTRSELAGCATPSGRREGSSGDAACCTPVRDSSTSPGSSTCQHVRSRASDHRGPLPIIFNTLSLKVSDEKAVGEHTVYRDIHTHGGSHDRTLQLPQHAAATRDRRPFLPRSSPSETSAEGRVVLNENGPVPPRKRGWRQAEGERCLRGAGSACRCPARAARRGSRSRSALLAAAAACRQRPMDPACQGVQQA